MGVTFRSGGYIKHVSIGGRTIKDGEAAAIWNAKGEHKQIIGPKREFMVNSTIRFLTRYRAQSHQYLKISHIDGRVEHVPGPASIFQNPAYHDSISVESAYRLGSSSECLVVCCEHDNDNNNNTDDSLGNSSSKSFGTDDKSPKEGTVASTTCGTPSSCSLSTPSRMSTSENVVITRLIHGPTLFIPKPSDHVHTFTWSNDEHYSCPTQAQVQTQQFLPQSFNILHTSGKISLKATIPTIDGFSFDATLIVPYKIKSITPLDVDETNGTDGAFLLQSNVDVTKELYDALLFDTQLLGDTFSSEVLKSKKEDVVSALSKVETYPSLLKAAIKCGLHIGETILNETSIQVIKIEVCSSLLKQIDQEQRLAANLQSEVTKKSLTTKICSMEMQEQRQKVDDGVALKRMQIVADDALDIEHFKMKMDALERQMTLELRQAKVAREVRKVEEEGVLEFLGRMKQLDIDMTKFMTTYGGIKVAGQIIGQSALLPEGDRW
eukprot:CAMPEP_0203686344 /NCGR_PEP_ID=MMETSP0090-20130426/49014_1 /ASSEMBLY_ACC=CAM_ASM_001088 /TAXON_ID=426623 /ORGANISM="Chaetoceros affinis, Strain CCMP159" /LENGTH=492 /DNA_ID=CAMNT_0050555565 /DNA_START=38 /DNA_END=1513 /DNA_ORIENTATION=-